jgi:hypothetical protein
MAILLPIGEDLFNCEEEAEVISDQKKVRAKERLLSE